MTLPYFQGRTNRPVALRHIAPGGQGPTKPAQEFGEVLVDDGLVMVPEPARRLAGGEAEHGRADQPFGARDLALGQAALAQRGLHRVPDRPRGRGDGRRAGRPAGDAPGPDRAGRRGAPDACTLAPALTAP